MSRGTKRPQCFLLTTATNGGRTLLFHSPLKTVFELCGGKKVDNRNSYVH